MTTDSWRTILVRYGEIGIKSAIVRNRFENRLVQNIEDAFLAKGVEGVVEREWGRLYVRARDVPGAVAVLTRTFGIVSASPAEEVPATIEGMSEALAARSRDILKAGQSFAVRARRTGDQAFTSMDVQKAVGSAIFVANEEKGPRVDLTKPDVEFFLEVRPDKAYYYREVHEGPGGLPMGTQGRVTALVESPRSVLAVWLMLRRGCSVLPLAFTPLAPEVEESLRLLADWAPSLKVTTVPLPPEARGPLARRRFALDVMRRFTWLKRGYAIVVEDDFQEAAQLAPLDTGAGSFPVFRPLVGFVGPRRERLVRAVGVGPLLTAPRPGDGEVEAPLPDDLTTLSRASLDAAQALLVAPRARDVPLGEAFQ